MLDFHTTDTAVGLPKSELTLVSESEEGIHANFYAPHSTVWIHPLDNNVIVLPEAEPRVQLRLRGVSNRTFLEIRKICAWFPLWQGSHKSGRHHNQEKEAQKR